MAGLSLGVADKMSHLMYSFKHGLRKQYFMALDALKEVLDERLYDWYYQFGCLNLGKEK